MRQIRDTAFFENPGKNGLPICTPFIFKKQGNKDRSFVRLLFLQNERLFTFVFFLFVLFQKFLLRKTS
jgi:hypothetical protein